VLRPGGVLIGWDYAPRSSRALNRLHRRLLLLAGDARPPHLRGFGPLAEVAIGHGFGTVERPLLPPFLFPPIPHTVLLARTRDADTIMREAAAGGALPVLP
jgi:hypothetical protein